MYKTFIKQTIDFTLALIGLLIISPLFVLITLFLSFANKGKPFFFQARPGKDEKIFKIIKFKTMNERKDENGNLLHPTKRVTSVGRFIRSTSIDEIPQLINVLKGDMSFVGPRPLRIEYLPLYSPMQARRHKVTPGITGWTQINGRNSLSWDEKFQLDVWYVDNQSFWLDIKIFFLTFWKVIRKDGVNQSKQITMKPFKGIKLNG